MRSLGTWFVLLAAAIHRVAAQELQAIKISLEEEDTTITPLDNRNGWVNPEDLPAMPQCIAQQDPSTWLSAMTDCTGRECTRHFGRFCIHNQWRIQLSCLKTRFSPEVVMTYLPYCSRSVLAKAQLYEWIRTVTERRWLVNFGDAIDSQNISPMSLTEGYAAVDVVTKAPACLTESVSSSSRESFQRIMTSCRFEAATRHTGNANRPWEYSESLRSMTSLDSETVGYDLTGRWISYGNYFDKRCFCGTFNPQPEVCSGPGLSLTKERLWFNATCGPSYLPGNWADGLKTTPSAYIPTKNWHWPKCVDDIPHEVMRLTGQCTTDACELDSSGYCITRRAVNRACFCSKISYSTCKGSCHVFETRIDYVNWLHSLCGAEQNWHGLPKHWRELATPTSLDMIPWDWSVKPSRDSESAVVNHSKSRKFAQACTSAQWKLFSLALINLVTLLAGLRPSTAAIRELQRYSSLHWFPRGLLIAAFHLLASGINAMLVQSTPGYDKVPIVDLVLLWCSLPRSTWLTILLVSFQPFQATVFSAAATCILSEVILQALAAYYMIMTVGYGRDHSFYSGGMAKLDTAPSARHMYAGALMWLVVVIVALVSLIQVAWKIDLSDDTEANSSQAREHLPTQQPATPFEERWTWVEEKLARYWMEKSCDMESTPLINHERQTHAAYGTLPVKRSRNRNTTMVKVRVYLIAMISMFLLWIAQWLFWAGFIGLAAEEFCLPKLGLLTGVWTVSAVAVTTIAVGTWKGR